MHCRAAAFASVSVAEYVYGGYILEACVHVIRALSRVSRRVQH